MYHSATGKKIEKLQSMLDHPGRVSLNVSGRSLHGRIRDEDRPEGPPMGLRSPEVPG